MSYWGWPPYVSAAQRKVKSKNAVKKLLKKGKNVFPIQVEGRIIAKSFWGKAWCDHLESFSDYESRLPRGRTYIRNGSVIHLEINQGKIEALVQGSSLYKVQVDIRSIDQKKWKSISQKCSSEIGSVVELLQGKLSTAVMSAITNKANGLFPHSDEIKFSCSCPDWAEMCKHVAAVLYGVGARLDKEPELLFTLRKVDHLDLINNVSVKTNSKNSISRLSKNSKALQDKELSDLFGIEIEDKLIKAESKSKIIPKVKKKKKKIIKKTTKKKKKIKN
jgi:uncharacterized Zn finger protein